jgi:hypothetical protein
MMFRENIKRKTRNKSHKSSATGLEISLAARRCWSQITVQSAAEDGSARSGRLRFNTIKMQLISFCICGFHSY